MGFCFSRKLQSLALAAALAAACAPKADVLELKGDQLAPSYADLRLEMLKARCDIRRFLARGPVKTDLRSNLSLAIEPGVSVVFDHVAPRGIGPAPLVILVHGNRSRKEAHRHQAELLASFGMHALALDVPNRGQWLVNGGLIKRFVQRLVAAPTLLQGEIDLTRIVLAGHSFGGSAVTLAAALGAPVKGLILLDPAVVNAAVTRMMKNVRVPTLIVGADPEVFRSRRRRLFFRELAGPVFEVSVKGATHDDAQGPSMYALTTFGVDPYTSSERQKVFAALLAAGAFGLTAGGSLEFAAEAITAGRFADSLKETRTRAATRR